MAATGEAEAGASSATLLKDIVTTFTEYKKKHQLVDKAMTWRDDMENKGLDAWRDLGRLKLEKSPIHTLRPTALAEYKAQYNSGNHTALGAVVCDRLGNSLLMVAPLVAKMMQQVEKNQPPTFMFYPDFQETKGDKKGAMSVHDRWQLRASIEISNAQVNTLCDNIRYISAMKTGTLGHSKDEKPRTNAQCIAFIETNCKQLEEVFTSATVPKCATLGKKVQGCLDECMGLHFLPKHNVFNSRLAIENVCEQFPKLVPDVLRSLMNFYSRNYLEGGFSGIDSTDDLLGVEAAPAPAANGDGAVQDVAPPAEEAAGADAKDARKKLMSLSEFFGYVRAVKCKNLMIGLMDTVESLTPADIETCSRVYDAGEAALQDAFGERAALVQFRWRLEHANTHDGFIYLEAKKEKTITNDTARGIIMKLCPNNWMGWFQNEFNQQQELDNQQAARQRQQKALTTLSLLLHLRLRACGVCEEEAEAAAAALQAQKNGEYPQDQWLSQKMMKVLQSSSTKLVGYSKSTLENVTKALTTDGGDPLHFLDFNTVVSTRQPRVPFPGKPYTTKGATGYIELCLDNIKGKIAPKFFIRCGFYTTSDERSGMMAVENGTEMMMTFVEDSFRRASARDSARLQSYEFCVCSENFAAGLVEHRRAEVSFGCELEREIGQAPTGTMAKKEVAGEFGAKNAKEPDESGKQWNYETTISVRDAMNILSGDADADAINAKYKVLVLYTPAPEFWAANALLGRKTIVCGLSDAHLKHAMQVAARLMGFMRTQTNELQAGELATNDYTKLAAEYRKENAAVGPVTFYQAEILRISKLIANRRSTTHTNQAKRRKKDPLDISQDAAQVAG
eukprot:g18715.t1